MNTNVRLRVQDGSYAIDLLRDQWRLISSLLEDLLDAAHTPGQLGLVVGVNQNDIDSIIEQASPRPPLGLVTLVLSLPQLHAVHALLNHACARAESEEAFYNRTGGFVEHARGIAASIEEAFAAQRSP